MRHFSLLLILAFDNGAQSANLLFVFTAIFLDAESRDKLALTFGAVFGNAVRVLCEHCTLSLGRSLGTYSLGQEVSLVATHFGALAGRVMAVKVSGVTRADGKQAHVTVATFGEGKPKDSNDITAWEELCVPIFLRGIVRFSE